MRYIIIKTGTNKLLSDQFSTDYDLMQRNAALVGGVVTNTVFFRRKFNFDPTSSMTRIMATSILDKELKSDAEAHKLELKARAEFKRKLA